MALATMRVAGLLACGALLFGGPARADWTVYGGNLENSFFSTEKVTAPLSVSWKHNTNVYAERSGNRGGPVIANGIVYFPSKNIIYAVDAHTGEQKWRAPDASHFDPNVAQVSSTPVISPDFLYIPRGDGTLSAVNLRDGVEVWAFRTGGAIRSSPTLVGNNLYFGSDDDFMYCIDSRTGELRWKSNDGRKEYRMSDDPIGAPVIYNGALYVNSADQKLWGFQADTGRLMFQQRLTAASLDISPVAHNGRIYLAAGDAVHQFRLRGGGSRAFTLNQWLEGEISTTPLITDRFWFIGDRGGYFHAFTNMGRPVMATNGEPWRVRLEGRPQGTPIITADTIYVSTDKGFLYAIDLNQGAVTWTYRTEAPKGIEPLFAYYAIRAPMAVSDGRLYVLGDDGTLTCLMPEAPDYDGPIISGPRPTRGTVMNGLPPLPVSVYLWDEGSGINPETIELTIDGQPVERDPAPYWERGIARTGWVYDPVRRQLTYSTPRIPEGQPEVPMVDGRHTIQVQAADWRGNYTSLEWSFIVDNSLPRRAVAARPTRAQRTSDQQDGQQPGAPGMPMPPGMGPGGMMGPGGYGGMMGPGGMQGEGGAFGNQTGGYQYRGNQRGGRNQRGGGMMGPGGGGMMGPGGMPGMGGNQGGRGGGRNQRGR